MCPAADYLPPFMTTSLANRNLTRYHPSTPFPPFDCIKSIFLTNIVSLYSLPPPPRSFPLYISIFVSTMLHTLHSYCLATRTPFRFSSASHYCITYSNVLCHSTPNTFMPYTLSQRYACVGKAQKCAHPCDRKKRQRFTAVRHL